MTRIGETVHGKDVVRSGIHQAPKGWLKWSSFDLGDPVITVEFAVGEGGNDVENRIGETTDVEDVLALLRLRGCAGLEIEADKASLGIPLFELHPFGHRPSC